MHNKSPEFLKLQAFFYWLITNLEEFVTPQEYKSQISFLRCIKRKVINQALLSGLIDSEIPFLPVLQSTIRGRNSVLLSRQVEFIKCNGSAGTYSLNLNKIENIPEEKIPKHHPYFLLGVKTNIGKRILSTREMTESIINDNEIPLTLAEIISLLIHKPEILLKYSVQACGSRYDNVGKNKNERAPHIKLVSGKPVITWVSANEVVLDCISPSCIKRIGTIGLKALIQGRPWRMVGPI